MRTVHWLFVVSAAMFVSGIGFVIAGARSMQRAAPVEAAAPALAPVATMAQIMSGIVDPAANAVFNSVSTVVSERGVEEVAPQNDAEWTALGSRAAALIEAGNLIMMEGRAVDEGDWMTMSRAMMDAGRLALEAAEKQDTEGILDSGGAIYASCETCHERYWRQ